MRRPLALLILVALAGVLLGSGPHAPAALDAERFVVTDGSRFWIEGTTSVNSFRCEAPHVAGFANVEATETEETAVEAVVAVPVRAFDCGIRQMNRDLYDALQGRQHPAVRFALDGAEVLGRPDSDGWANVRAWGTLALAGAERPVTLDAEGRRLADGRVELRGQHALRMTDFNIDPPRGPLGIVRARDQITVRFALLAHTK